jgi:K+/H+ antiporter YhaU regulatory subunit KhtT
MKTRIESPVYAQIALDIAMRIANGELKENSRISGRSTLAGEYKASPETVRRALKILEDVKIIEIRDNVGSVIKSRSKAVDYIERHNLGKDLRNLKFEIKNLLNKHKEIDEAIYRAADEIYDLSEKLKHTNPVYTMEFDIPPSSPLIGRTIQETNFWHMTGATIVAVRRKNSMILSPGPYLTFMADDVLLVVGDTSITQKVETMIQLGK